ncbi:dihydroorotase-like cyclic amidohydrolase [Paraburkholderia sp. MM5477-R1]
MPGVQTLLPVMLDHVSEGRLSLQRLVELTSAGPARVFGIAEKGCITVGYDADLTLVDLKARREITNRRIASVCGWTPYDGMRVTGWPVATIIRGHVVMRDDAVQGCPVGQPVRFDRAMAITPARRPEAIRAAWDWARRRTRRRGQTSSHLP